MNYLFNIFFLISLLTTFAALGQSPSVPSNRIVQATNIESMDSDKSYIYNGLAELGGVQGWNCYVNTGATPQNGTGGSPAVTWTKTTTTPLTDKGSFLLTKDAVNRQGQGCGYAFTIDASQQAKVLSIRANYIVRSGTFVAGSASANSDVTVWIVDVTNNQVIQPSSFRFLSNSSNISDQFQAEFQSAPNSTSYRLLFHVATTSASAYVLGFDDIKVSPSRYVYGTPITDWSLYTPSITSDSGSLTNYTVLAYWRRVGDTVELKGNLQFTGTVGTWSGPRISNPPGIIFQSPTWVMDGVATAYDTGVSNSALTVNAYASNGIRLYRKSPNSPNVDETQSLSQAAPFAFGATDGFNWYARNQVTGWSSSVQMSDSADTRVVALSVYNPGATSLTGGTSNTNLTTVLSATDTNTHNAFNSATGQFTVPVSGVYNIKGSIFVTNGGSQQNISLVLVAGSRVITLQGLNFGASVSQVLSGSFIATLRAGDVVYLRSNSSVGSYTFGQFGDSNLCIERISGPSAIAATETVAAKYRTSSAQSIPNNAGTSVVWNTLIKDTHGAMNTSTGVFTVPIAGWYSVQAVVAFATNSNGVRALDLTGGNSDSGPLVIPSTSSSGRVSLSTTNYYTAGQTIATNAYQNSGGVLALTSNASENWVSIIRIGL